jgi:N6-L-threonylcarbamoyladenine synthase
LSGKNDPLILGIESSCDETSAAILKGFQVCSHIVYSQMIHQHYGGVVPELASREHEKAISMVCERAFMEAGKTAQEIDAVAVTYGPGLMGALLVGLNFAKGLALALNKPLIGINHIEGHLYAPFLEFKNLTAPYLCLLVSGGHTMLIDVQGLRQFKILGQTLDDAAGESFDKTARLLKLGYPGGPLIDQISQTGNSQAVRFPRALLDKDSLDMSFSGLKTAVLNYIRQNPPADHQAVADISASFQAAVTDTLVEKVRRAVLATGHQAVVLAGGVAANSRLREKMMDLAAELTINLFYPPLAYCTDNAAMIAAAGVLYYREARFSPLNLTAQPNLKLQSADV